MLDMINDLSLVIERDGLLVSRTPISDPFHTTKITLSFSFIEWLKLLFVGEVKVTVKVDSKGESIRHWFCDVVKDQPHLPTIINGINLASE